jgi:hypothetical protein
MLSKETYYAVKRDLLTNVVAFVHDHLQSRGEGECARET